MKPIPKEFKEGDRVMGIHQTGFGYKLVGGKIYQVERIGVSNYPLLYLVEGVEHDVGGVLSPDEAIQFTGFHWAQAYIFHEERKRLLKEAEEKMKLIKLVIYEPTHK